MTSQEVGPEREQRKQRSVGSMSLGIFAPGNTLTVKDVIWVQASLNPASLAQFSSLDTLHCKGLVISSGQWLLTF